MKFWEKRRYLGRDSLLVGAALAVVTGFGLGVAVADGWNDSSSAPNTTSIVNTRHNLTMSYSPFQGEMGPYRNNYYEICVYCHTPHGANSTAAAPLWNRTVIERNYTLYDNSASLAGGNTSQPGPNSLTCLSCHDGVTAIDSVINMPTQVGGAFRAGYSQDQESDVNFDFLNAWGAAGNNLFERVDQNGDPLLVPQPTDGTRPTDGIGTGHSGLANFGDGSGPCITCHNPGETGGQGRPPNFYAFLIGSQMIEQTGSLDSDGFPVYSFSSVVQDVGGFLADDHPIGVSYPQEFGAKSGYNEPDIRKPKIAFWDKNSNNHADPNEVRLYDTGEGYEVECGSCHDPHGVKVTDSTDAAFIPSFLRVGATATQEPAILSVSGTTISGNAGSELCLTCHVK